MENAKHGQMSEMNSLLLGRASVNNKESRLMKIIAGIFSARLYHTANCHPKLVSGSKTPNKNVAQPKKRHPQASAVRPGDPGENMEALFNLDCRI